MGAIQEIVKLFPLKLIYCNYSFYGNISKFWNYYSHLKNSIGNIESYGIESIMEIVEVKLNRREIEQYRIERKTSHNSKMFSY